MPPIVYGPEDIVRKVQSNGTITYRNRTYRLGKGLRGQPVALRPTPTDGVLAVYFCQAQVGQLDLRLPVSGLEAADRELARPAGSRDALEDTRYSRIL